MLASRAAELFLFARQLTFDPAGICHAFSGVTVNMLTVPVGDE